ncbi:hypothetical protein [Pseudooceanicola sp. MF1-13]|uniref:hypothetical protein n=1 Tax=Pseudooceanicola sp. MF1-13 TaxID=3379095 RepID=UPI0038917269
MSNNIVQSKQPGVLFARYEQAIPVRGCKFSLSHIKDFYREIEKINKKFGESVILGLPRIEEMTDEQWQEHKDFLLEDGFRLTVTIIGWEDQSVYGDTAEIFDDEEIPKPIKSIHFNNITSFSRHAEGREPLNRVSVTIDFEKPSLFDPNPLVSEATQNDGIVNISASDITFFKAAQHSVEKNLLKNKTWYAAIHRNFAYDFGVWFIAMPLAIYFSGYYMNVILPEGSPFDIYRWPLFVYLAGLCLVIYRALTLYAKWAFPVNVLVENHDRALKHRLALGAVIIWLFWQILGTGYDLIVR